MTTPTIIDTKMHGHDRLTGCFLLRGEQTALVETGPKSSVENVFRELDSLGIERLEWIVVTHIHLDHAGAAGTLARRFPEATIAVHHVGAPFLVDPTKLWSSARRLFGDDMERLWGGIDPIEKARLRTLEDGDKVDLGGRSLQAIETPGHAFHHHALFDDATGILFAGDALGVRLPDIGVIRPATPPPEFHLEKAIASIERIKELDPSEVWLTHFGPATGASVGDTCDGAIDALERWASWVKSARTETDELDRAAELVAKEARSALEQELSPPQVERMERTTSYWMNTWGYMRYFDKQNAR